MDSGFGTFTSSSKFRLQTFSNGFMFVAKCFRGSLVLNRTISQNFFSVILIKRCRGGKQECITHLSKTESRPIQSWKFGLWNVSKLICASGKAQAHWWQGLFTMSDLRNWGSYIEFSHFHQPFLMQHFKNTHRKTLMETVLGCFSN